MPTLKIFFTVDADWLIAWVETFYSSSYRPGIYGDPEQGPLNSAFCEATARSELVANQAVFWSSEPEPGTTPKKPNSKLPSESSKL